MTGGIVAMAVGVPIAARASDRGYYDEVGMGVLLIAAGMMVALGGVRLLMLRFDASKLEL